MSAPWIGVYLFEAVTVEFAIVWLDEAFQYDQTPKTSTIWALLLL